MFGGWSVGRRQHERVPYGQGRCQLPSGRKQTAWLPPGALSCQGYPLSCLRCMQQGQHVPGGNYSSEVQKQLTPGSIHFIQNPPIATLWGRQGPLNHKASWGREAGACTKVQACSKSTDPKGLRQLQEEKGVAGIVGLTVDPKKIVHVLTSKTYVCDLIWKKRSLKM